jgi:hypothetical protein
MVAGPQALPAHEPVRMITQSPRRCIMENTALQAAGHPLNPRVFARRLARNGLAAGALIGASLGAGMLGYHELERLDWTDAFLNAAMILSGMGPINDPATEAGKIFAGCYALYSGFVVLLTAGIMAVPIAHRLMHLVHQEAEMLRLRRTQGSGSEPSAMPSNSGVDM